MTDPYVGEIRAFAFDKVPDGWYPCDGRTLSARDLSASYAVIGNTYGGVMFETFAIPNLLGTTPIGAGAPAPGVSGEGSAGATLAVNWCIAYQGEFPIRPPK